MDNHQRIKIIYRMLIELASGNLSYRIKSDGSDKEFDEIATLLNDAASKMQNYNFESPYFKTISIDAENPAAQILKKVREYILNHLEEPLPSTNELSKMFGTNEFTLKESFRNILKTSIYQFYNDERLKKALVLIEQTYLPLKEIAFLCGFNVYGNFAKAFKKKYHKAPSEVLRPQSP